MTYDPDATHGLTAEDMVQAISIKYGTPTWPVDDMSFRLTNCIGRQERSSPAGKIRWEVATCKQKIYKCLFSSRIVEYPLVNPFDSLLASVLFNHAPIPRHVNFGEYMEAGERGIIYQSVGWLFCSFTGPTEKFLRPDGKVYDARNVHLLTRDRRFGKLRDKRTRAEQKKLPISQGCEFYKDDRRKLRYVGFYGDRRTKRILRAALRWEVLPYPKQVSSPKIAFRSSISIQSVLCSLLRLDINGAIHFVLWERQHEPRRPTFSFSVMFSTRVPLGSRWKLWKGSLFSSIQPFARC